MKKIVLFLAVAFLVLSLSGTSMAALFGGSEYQVFNSSLSWDGANAAVVALGSDWHLVTITSQAEQDFVAGLLGSTEGLVWAGGSQALDPALGKGEGWSWVTGEDFYSYQAWATAFATEPNDWNGSNEIYLALDGRFDRNWTWNDGLTTQGIFGYVAERTAVPEPSTILLLGSGLVGLVGYGRRRFKK